MTDCALGIEPALLTACLDRLSTHQRPTCRKVLSRGVYKDLLGVWNLLGEGGPTEQESAPGRPRQGNTPGERLWMFLYLVTFSDLMQSMLNAYESRRSEGLSFSGMRVCWSNNQQVNSSI